MSETKKKTTTKKKTSSKAKTTKSKSPSKALLNTKVNTKGKDIVSSNSEDITKNNKTSNEIEGRFKKGNTIGYATRFQPGNDAASKYDDSFCEEMLNYFEDPKVVYPMFEGFATILGVMSGTLRRWADEHPRFADTYTRCLEIQKQRLLVGGLTEQYNSQIVKFIAVNCHGMKEKIEQEVKADASINVNISFFDEENK